MNSFQYHVSNYLGDINQIQHRIRSISEHKTHYEVLAHQTDEYALIRAVALFINWLHLVVVVMLLILSCSKMSSNCDYTAE